MASNLYHLDYLLYNIKNRIKLYLNEHGCNQDYEIGPEPRLILLHR